MPERPSPDLERMLTDVEWAMSKQFAARDLVPMLENLVRAAPPVSEAAYFAKLRLSELIVGDAPFRAARLARDVLVRGESERAWAVLGLAHTLLGNYRVAARSYRKALALAPECPVYEHNLGHVMDVAMDRPRDTLVHWHAPTWTCPARARSLARTPMPCCGRAKSSEPASCCYRP